MRGEERHDPTIEELEQLGPRGRQVTVAAVSADPVRGTPDPVRRWHEQHPLPPNFRYASGSEPRLEPVWKSSYAVQEHANPDSAHSARVFWLVGRQGPLRTEFSRRRPVPPRDPAHDLKPPLLDEPA